VHGSLVLISKNRRGQGKPERVPPPTLYGCYGLEEKDFSFFIGNFTFVIEENSIGSSSSNGKCKITNEK
jgi:hypothetical protein